MSANGGFILRPDVRRALSDNVRINRRAPSVRCILQHPVSTSWTRIYWQKCQFITCWAAV